MVSKSGNEFLTNRAWFKDVVGGKEQVLCYTSALECLDLFCGYIREIEIDVYAKQKGEYENINYRIVNSFDEIEIVQFDNVLCTSFNQTVNDMLGSLNDIDPQPLLEALNEYYFDHDKNFDGLVIKPENQERFDSIKDWAIEYHYMG
ncbi:MAG: hypothetical protein LBI42_13010 [Chitinispirillales bacterium]|jgi:hypothetical protein|nr:hypothetical protein [Chitinispirillales bacterium]